MTNTEREILEYLRKYYFSGSQMPIYLDNAVSAGKRGRVTTLRNLLAKAYRRCAPAHVLGL